MLPPSESDSFNLISFEESQVVTQKYKNKNNYTMEFISLPRTYTITIIAILDTIKNCWKPRPFLNYWNIHTTQKSICILSCNPYSQQNQHI